MHYLFMITCLVLAFSHNTQAQDAAQGDASGSSETQQVDPLASQAISEALQRGDIQGAKNLYQNLKKSQPPSIAPVATPTPEPAKPSLFETTLPGNLKQFGYDLFNKTVSTFTPPASMSVGPDYVIGPGDQFTMTLWGTTEGIYTLKVTKEGNITLPKVGVVPMAGIRFGELDGTLKRHLSKYYNDFNLSIAMGGLKTQTIYVVGEVTKPGSFSLSSLTTVYGALFVAGGPTKQGTFRSIQVLRSGRIIKTIDLYEFLLKGDRSQDIKLQNEDTVFVPLIGPVAGIAGAVYRPAIYELKGQETLEEVVKTAGGLLPIALGGRLQLTRYEDNQKKVFLDFKLAEQEAAAGKSSDFFREKVRNMDAVVIRPLYDRVWETVNLSGDVQNPGPIQWRSDLKLKEVIDQGVLLPTAHIARAEIIRLNKDFTDRQIIPVDLAGFKNGDLSQNVLLQPQDEIKVYTTFKRAEKVTMSGEVLRPGAYEVAKGDRLSDLLRRVGGITAEGYAYGAVFKRVNIKTAENKNLLLFSARMQTQMLSIAAGNVATAVSAEEAAAAKNELSINQGLLESLKTQQAQNDGRVAITISEKVDEWAGSKDDLILQDGDSLHIPKRPQEVLIIGEVNSPGAQIYLPGLTVKDYLDRRGGVTKNADRDLLFIVQADGYAFSSTSPNVGDIEKTKLKAGDSIFVPQKTERYAAMRTFKDIIDILFKTAVIFATVHVLF